MSLTVDGRSGASSAAGCGAAEEQDHLKTGWDFTWIKREGEVVRLKRIVSKKSFGRGIYSEKEFIFFK